VFIVGGGKRFDQFVKDFKPSSFEKFEEEFIRGAQALQPEAKK
jgi:hypothetical protein